MAGLAMEHPRTQRAPDVATRPILEMEHISKSFGATQALQDVSLTLYGGEIHALLGENGAGKSTLIKIMTGIHQPDTGEIRVDEQAGASWLLAGRPAPGRCRHLPGADDLPRPECGGEHLYRPPQPRAYRRPAGDEPRSRTRCWPGWM